MVDKVQISHSVKSIYGNEFEIVGYLRRFIDLDYQLPKPSAPLYCSYLYKVFEIEKLLQNKETGLLAIFSFIADNLNLTLRVQEQCFTQISIGIRVSTSIKPRRLQLFAALIAIKAANPKNYYHFVDQQISGPALLKEIGLTKDAIIKKDSSQEKFLYELEGLLFIAFATRDSMMEKLNNSSNNYDGRPRSFDLKTSIINEVISSSIKNKEYQNINAVTKLIDSLKEFEAQS